jgi:hypothetical protein
VPKKKKEKTCTRYDAPEKTAASRARLNALTMDESARVVRVAHRANLPVNESRNDIYLPLPCLNRYVCAEKKGKKKKTGSVPEKKNCSYPRMPAKVPIQVSEPRINGWTSE